MLSGRSGRIDVRSVSVAVNRLTHGSGEIGSAGSAYVAPAAVAINPTAQPSLAFPSRWQAVAASSIGSFERSFPPSARRFRYRPPS
jgi:hypothetical protein